MPSSPRFTTPKLKIPRKNFFLFVGLFPLAVLVSAEPSSLTDQEQAKVLVAKHLIGLIDSPQLPTLVSMRELQRDAYWRNFFSLLHRPELFPLVQEDLKRALAEVPYVGGVRGKPAVIVKTALRGLAPLPLVPIRELPPEERERVLAFTSGPLKNFSSTVYSSGGDFEAMIAEVALEAGSTFHSSLISEGFNRMGSLSANVRLKEKELDLIDANDRLNEWLHLWGVHLVLDNEKLMGGRLNFSAYTIEQKHSYDVQGSSFFMYEVQPLVENEFYPALGHAEVDQGFLLLFAQTIDQEVESTADYLTKQNVSLLKPTLFLSSSSIRVADILIRDSVSDSKDLRARFIDSVGHHEGFHKYIEPVLARAVSRGSLTETEKAVWHETGAYLYQLESSDARFSMLDLMLILSTALNTEPGFYANNAGAKQALVWLQRALPATRFLDASNDMRGDGLLELLKLSASALKQSAGDARQAYEVAARNGLRD